MEVIWIKDGSFPVLKENLCCAIGNFDGVHLGHQELIKKCKDFCFKSAVLTFYPHPFTLLKGLKPYRQLAPINHKIELIRNLGIDFLFIVEFTKDIANMPKEDFIKNLKKLGIVSVVCGYDFTFGRRAEGNTRDLAQAFTFHEIPKYQLDNVRVSTTYIKELLSTGDIEKANLMLGRKFSIIGKVVHGKSIGRLLGFPTANLDYGIYYLPKGGVYAVDVLLDNKKFLGMANIGYNPTIDFSEDVKLEVHIFNFNQDIYGKEIQICFIDRIRAERKFNSRDELVNQLVEDKQEIKRKYGGNAYETIGSDN